MTQRDLELELKAQQDQKQTRYKPFRAVITDSAGNQTGTNSIWANEGERLVYYIAWGVSSVGQALCDRIEPIIGLGVYIQYTDYISQFEVIRDDPLQRGSAAPNRRSYLYPTQQDVGRGGRHQLWIEAEMLQPLAVNPSTGLTVNIGPGLYDYFGTRKEYLGKSGLDISGSQPSGPLEHLYVGIYLDSSNTEQTIDGGTVATSTTATEPVWPAGAFPLAVVDLDDTQTTIDLSADIKNRKLLWSESIQDNLSATVAPTANDDLGDGYAPRSFWVDLTANKSYICVDATAASAVWNQIDAAGGGGSGSLVFISKTELTGDATTIDFSSLASTYGTLIFKGEVRSDDSSELDYIMARFNNDSGASNYTSLITWFSGTTTTRVGDGPTPASRMYVGFSEAANSRADTFAPFLLEIPNYALTDREKNIIGTSSVGGDRSAFADMSNAMVMGSWRSTAAINRVTFFPLTGTNFVDGSVIKVFGLNDS